MAIHGYKGGVISATAPTTSTSSASGVWTLDDQLQAGANWPLAPALATNSVRIRGSATAYLSRTPTTASNRKTWTFSAWVKRGTLGGSSIQSIFSAGASSSFPLVSLFWFNDYIDFYADVAGTATRIRTSAVYRDPSAWYHIVAVLDTTQATSSNRMKLYVNGSQVTALSTDSPPAQNAELSVNNTVPHYIGAYAYDTASNNFDGYITDINLIDGQALDPSYFGATNPSTGTWQPATYRGTYGTNGFYLPFTDNSALTTSSNVGLGKDFSGNGNYWTTNNISITAGSTYDSMTDVPTLTSATASNFATLNPLSTNNAGSIVNALSNGNLQLSTASANTVSTSTIAIRNTSIGQYYVEMTVGAIGGGAPMVGIAQPDAQSMAGTGYKAISYRANGSIETNGVTTASGLATFTTNDVLGMALDMTTNNGQITFYKNNTSIYTATNVITNFNSYDICFGCQTNTASTTTFIANFGQIPFVYTPPTGYVALNTFNLPTPTIGATASTQANKYFDALTYTGTGADARAVTGLNFQPDFVWIKRRNDVDYHNLFDVIRGATKRLFSNDTQAENTSAATLQSFNSNGFTVGTNDNVNANGSPLVAWNWKANGTGVSNTAGSITSTVSANTSAGFSVVTYTGNGTGGATVGHGLGVALKMLIVKNRVQGTYGNWNVWQSALTGSQYLTLNDTAGAGTNNNRWNGTVPTSTVFSLGADSFGNTNKSGDTYVAYCFSEVAGYSKFGSYTGNGSADGTFVYTGFRPRYVLMKRTNAIGNWILYDTARNTYNLANNMLFPNTSDAEDTSGAIDIVSNGFKARSTSASWNGSGDTYIYMAFAESPFNYANAR